MAYLYKPARHTTPTGDLWTWYATYEATNTSGQRVTVRLCASCDVNGPWLRADRIIRRVVTTEPVGAVETPPCDECGGDCLAEAVEVDLVFTDAPLEYDGFGSVSEPSDLAYRGRRLRQVAIYPEHYDWQMTRYRSGLYVALTEDEAGRWETDELLERVAPVAV
jgi:hypothetical protein